MSPGEKKVLEAVTEGLLFISSTHTETVDTLAAKIMKGRLYQEKIKVISGIDLHFSRFCNIFPIISLQGRY